MASERGRYIVEFRDIPAKRQKIAELTAEQRARNFKEVKLGFTEEIAIKEAKRCLSCRKCLGCALCLAECHNKAIDFEQPDHEIELTIDSVILAPGCERFSCLTNEKLGHGKYPNVVTAIEFESILSDKGLYGDLVIRPYDGEIPRRIAFVQCFDYQDKHGLSYAAKEIFIAQEKVDGLEVHLFVSDWGTDQGGLVEYWSKESKITLWRGKVLAIQESQDSGNLTIEFAENGETKQQEFDLVVLVTAFNLPVGMEELGKKLGLEKINRCYWEIADLSLAETSRSGVFFTGYAFTGEPLGFSTYTQIRRHSRK